MYIKLKKYFKETLPFSENELEFVDAYFDVKALKKKEYILRDNEVCKFIGFIETGSVRHFHVKNGIEKTCDISFENTWITDFKSFTEATVSKMNLQALEETTVLVISKPNLHEIYQECSKYETFGRLMAERVAQRATEIAMSLSANTPEERFNNLLKSQPGLFRRVPQKYIANYLGISPESLSRIRSRIYQSQKS